MEPTSNKCPPASLPLVEILLFLPLLNIILNLVLHIDSTKQMEQTYKYVSLSVTYRWSAIKSVNSKAFPAVSVQKTRGRFQVLFYNHWPATFANQITSQLAGTYSQVATFLTNTGKNY